MTGHAGQPYKYLPSMSYRLTSPDVQLYGCRDIPVAYIANKENSFNDPSHDTVLHHWWAGNRDYASRLDVDISEMTPTGYVAKYVRALFGSACKQCGCMRITTQINLSNAQSQMSTIWQCLLGKV